MISIYIEFTNVNALNRILDFIIASKHNMIDLYIIIDNISIFELVKSNKIIDDISLEYRKNIKKNIISNKTKLLHWYAKNYCRNNNIAVFSGYANNYQMPDNTDDFSQWLNGDKCEHSDYYKDFLVSTLLERKLSNCANSSCLGKTLYISKSGIVSYCIKNHTKTILGDLSDFNDFDSVFDNKRFLNVLENHINRRKNCSQNCEVYKYCCGSCPIETPNYCEVHKSTYHKVTLLTSDIKINHKSLNNYNSDIKSAILKTIAFNKFLEKEKNNEQEN